MALGGNYNNNATRNNNDPTYYSKLRFVNGNTQTGLSFSYWKGILKLSIYDMKDTGSNKRDELASIYLSPMKAYIFSEYVKNLIDNPETFDVCGVDTGASETRGLIVCGAEMGKPYILIGKVTPDGTFEGNQRFFFQENSVYGLKFSDIDKLKFVKENNNKAELIMFYNLLVDYSRSSSGAYGASIFEIGKYEIGRQTNLLKRMAEKLGVETGGNSNGGGRTYSSDSYFNRDGGSSTSSSSSNGGNFSNNAGGNGKKYSTIDSLEDELG